MIKLVKLLVFAFNFLFVLAGLAILIVGIVIKAGYNEYFDFVPDGIFTAPRILIAVGLIVFLVAFLGCCGAIKDSRWMLVLFMIALGLLFILEIAGAIAAYAMRGSLKDNIMNKMTNSLQNFDVQDREGVTKTWDMLQSDAKCCGVKVGYEDWGQRFDFSQSSDFIKVPGTCCKSTKDSEGQGEGCPYSEEETVQISQANASDLLFKDGCFNKIQAITSEHNGIVAGTAVGIAVIEIIGIIFAWLLFKDVRSRYETV